MKAHVVIITLIIVISLTLTSISPSQEIISEQWMDVFFLQSKIGILHVITDKSEYQGKNVFRTVSIETTYGLRGEADITTEIKSIEYEDENMKPISTEIIMNISKAVTTISADFNGNKTRLKVTTAKQSNEKELNKPEDLLLTWGIHNLMLSKGFKTGTTYSYQTFFPDKFGFANITSEVLGKEIIQYNDKKMELNKIKSVIKDLNLTFLSYVDDLGISYKMEMPTVGIKYLKTETPELSREKKDPTQNLNLFDTFKKPSGDLKKLENVYKAKKISLLISSKNLDLHEVIQNDHRQKIKFEGNNNAEVTLYSTKKMKLKKKLKRPFNSETWVESIKKSPENQMKPYLTDSPFIQSNNEKIQKTALEIVGNEFDVFKCSKLINKWVFKNLKNKNYTVIYASALEVLENLEGDCSEHSLLFIALARSLGIPARGVLGLVYSEDINAFAFHVWAEVFAGKWIGMDPSLGLDFMTPVHIGVVRTDMNDLSFSGESVKLFELIQDFEIKIP